MIVLLEGPNGVGKTTVSKIIQDKYPNCGYQHFPTEGPPDGADFRWFIRDYTKVFYSLDPDRVHIVDRLWPSTVAYQEVNLYRYPVIVPYISSCFSGSLNYYLRLDATDLRKRQQRGNKGRMDRDAKGVVVDPCYSMVQRYDHLVACDLDNWIILDAIKAPEDLADIIIEGIENARSKN